MAEAPATRRWECLLGDKWHRIVSLDWVVLVLDNGITVVWRATREDVPNQNVQLRYTVPVRGTWMAWKPGGFVLLAEDYRQPGIAEAVRQAQLKDRRRRTCPQQVSG